MSERPDLEAIRLWNNDNYAANSWHTITRLLDYAARLEREAEGLNKILDEVRNLEWGDDGQECRFCYGIPDDPEDGHASNCPLAIALAAAP